MATTPPLPDLGPFVAWPKSLHDNVVFFSRKKHPSVKSVVCAGSDRDLSHSWNFQQQLQQGKGNFNFRWLADDTCSAMQRRMAVFPARIPPFSWSTFLEEQQASLEWW